MSFTALPRVGVLDRMALMRWAPKAFPDRFSLRVHDNHRASTHSIPSENTCIAQSRNMRTSFADHDDEMTLSLTSGILSLILRDCLNLNDNSRDVAAFVGPT